MKLRPLGTTGIMVSPLGLGSVKFGRNLGIKYPTPYALPSDSDIENILDQAMALGINVIDTAPAYGSSEQRLGQLLRHRRDQFCLVTKVGEEFAAGVSSFDFSEQHIRFSVERSLKRLQTDYLDVVLIHSDGNDMAIIEQSDAIETLLSLKERGIIKAVGMSTKTVAGGLAALTLLDVAMVMYNLRESSERPVLTSAANQNKGIFVKKALASGHLCKQNSETELTSNFRHIFSEPGVSSIIIGSINPVHLLANAEAVATALNQA